MTATQRPTLHDVARRAGLSVTQTSRALNGHDDVAVATRDHVLAVAADLGYAPNLAARRLKMPDTGSHSIGLVLATASQRFSDPFFGELLAAMVDEAATHGFELQLSTPLFDDDPTMAYRRAIQDKRVDGFILLRTQLDDARAAYLRNVGFPHVTYGRVDDASAAVDESDDCLQAAVDHLVGLGHERIGCLSEPPGYAIGALRLESFRRAMQVHGLAPAPAHIVLGGFHEDSGFTAASTLLDLTDPPSAVVACNDLTAMGAIRAAAERGVAVPHELSVIGFDDIEAARFVSPPLTTMRNPAADTGRLLIRRLLSVIARRDDHADVLVEPTLVVRESTAPPAR